jgi:hypothetical protein
MTQYVVFGFSGLADAEDRMIFSRPGGSHAFPSRPDAIVPFFMLGGRTTGKGRCKT